MDLKRIAMSGPRLDRRQVLAGAAMLAASTQLGAQGTTHLNALVVGIDKYKSLNPLTRAVRDAEDVAKRVKAYGYDVTLALDASADELLAAQQEFIRKLEASPGSASFCYFACHGAQYGGANFLLPKDVDASDGEKMLEGSVQFDDILSQIRQCRPGQSIVVLDACRNDPAVAALPGTGQGFAATNVPNGFYVVYSTGSGELAVDDMGPGDKDPNGLFARSLLKHISPVESFDGIMKQVKVEVSKAARSIGRSQNPGVFNLMIREPLLDPDAAERAAKAPPPIGRMNSTAVILWAADRNSAASANALPDLVSPSRDAERLAAQFKSFGADVHLLLNPDAGAVTATCDKVARSGVADIVLFYSGHGALADGDGVLLFPLRTPASAPFSGIAKAAGVQALTLAGLAGMLRRPPDTPAQGTTRGFTLLNPGKTGSTRPAGPRLTFLIDSQLSASWGYELDTKSTISLLDEARAVNRVPEISNVAAIYATGIWQEAIDAVEGGISSPFAIALNNALSRPGLTLAQLASQVRTEVEEMTKGFQTPTLFAPIRMRDLVLVTPVT